MKKTVAIILVSFLVVILSASFILAGNIYDPQIKKRIVTQEKRINKGIASGCLTRAEARTLQYHLNCIRAEESRLKLDGHLTKRERARLHRMLDKNSKNFYCRRYNTLYRLY